MTATISPLRDRHDRPLHHQLVDVVREEFRGEIITLDVDHPVFARGRCQVNDCDRGAWSRLLCLAHYTRWRTHERPDLEAFCATTGPVRVQAGSELVDAFDLRQLGSGLRLEVAYIVQCYHDDRTVRLLPGMVRGVVQLLVAAEVDSLLDRPLEAWLADAAATGRVDVTRLNGILRYAFEHFADLVEGVDADAEFARDLWRAKTLGIATIKGHPPDPVRQHRSALATRTGQALGPFPARGRQEVRLGRHRRSRDPVAVEVPQRTAPRHRSRGRPDQGWAR